MSEKPDGGDGGRGREPKPEPVRPVTNPHGNASYHPSVADYEHEGLEHTSKHR